MKKQILLIAITIILLFISVMSFAQTAQDCRQKLQVIGTTIKITNKTCLTCFTIKRTGKLDTTTAPIAANATLTLTIPFQCGSISIRPVENCSCTCPYGWVTVNTCTLLPVNFTSLSGKMANNQANVNFSMGDMTGVKKFIVYFSYDGITWIKQEKEIPVISNQFTYTADFKL